MDVRCEKCLTEYEFDDAQVTEAGVAVKCTTCGHVFRVKRMAAAAPAGHSDEFIPDQANFDRSREWKIRQANGSVFTCRELTTLQKWIVERKIARDDEISLSGDQWKRLGDIPELAGFFLVVDQANKAQMLEQQMRQNPSLTSAPTMISQGPMAPPAGYQMGRPPARQEPAWASSDADPEEDDLRAIKRGGPGAGTFILLLLVAAAGGGYWYAHTHGIAPFGQPTAPAAPSQPVASNTPPAQPPTPTATVPVVPDAGAAAPVAAASAPDAGADAGTTASAEPRDAGPASTATTAAPIEAKAKTPAAPEHKPVVAAPKTFEGFMAEGSRWEQRERPERALEAYQSAIELEPGSAEAWAGKGQALIDLSRYNEAEAAFNHSLSISPRFSDAEMGLADAFRFQGKKSAAIKQYKKYLDDHPDGDGASIARNAMASLSE